MHYKSFDTHKYIKELQETGFNEQQAEMLVKSLLASRDFDLSILATYDQVSKLGVSLDKKIDQVEAKLDKKIDQVEAKLDKKIADLKSELKVTLLPHIRKSQMLNLNLKVTLLPLVRKSQMLNLTSLNG